MIGDQTRRAGRQHPDPADLDAQQAEHAAGEPPRDKARAEANHVLSHTRPRRERHPNSDA